jgi:hypothetical protein
MCAVLQTVLPMKHHRRPLYLLLILLTMTTTTLALLLAVLLLPILILLWASESTEQRARRLRSYGWTQRRIAEHMGISRSRVQRIVACG